jgi:hypothetical protein
VVDGVPAAADPVRHRVATQLCEHDRTGHAGGPGDHRRVYRAPLLAREYAAGTVRFTWTQGIGRTRWAVLTLGLLGMAVAAVGAITVADLTYSRLHYWLAGQGVRVTRDLAYGAAPTGGRRLRE